LTDRRFDQIWQFSPAIPLGADEGLGSCLHIQRLTGIEPISDRPGASDGDVPRALLKALFGQPATGPEIHSYALLDAARIPGLPEVLETSRLDHLCLFKGDRDDVGPTAPWLVRLKESDKFTRNLFRQSNRSWHLWGKDCGIFLRSAASLPALSDHFRRFTRIRDLRGRIAFFRFWDPLVAGTYFPGIAHDGDRVGQFFTLPGGAEIRIIAQTGPAEAISMAPNTPAGPGPRRRSLVFDALDEALFAEIAFRALARQLAIWLVTEYPDRLGARPPEDLRAMSTHVVSAGRRAGLAMKEDFAFLAQMMMTSGGWFLDDDSPVGLRKLVIDTPAPKAQALADAYSGMHGDTLQGQLFAQWDAVQAYLAALPEDEAVTPARFREFASRFLRLSAAAIPETIASTRARLRDLGLEDRRAEGRAVILCLIFGPRFFEDPFKPWSELETRPAIDAAWRVVTASE